ncbi:MAG: hypothetical protein F4Z33_00515 [Gemmatimonadales bacterium]|nr:hypothetical protein [Gemmatimonadales bacterium]
MSDDTQMALGINMKVSLERHGSAVVAVPREGLPVLTAAEVEETNRPPPPRRTLGERDSRGPVGRRDHPQPEGDAGLPEEAIAMNDQLNREEREILEKFDRGELRPVTGVEGEMTIARQAAKRSTLCSRIQRTI